MGFNGNYLFEQAHHAATCASSGRPSSARPAPTKAGRPAGAKSTVEKAQDKVREILAGEPIGFPDDLGREFDAIIATAERQAV